MSCNGIEIEMRINKDVRGWNGRIVPTKNK
jgi:hypothetical protein